MKLKLFITLLLLAVMPAFAQNTGVSGVVVDADSGQPIAGATVLLQQGSSAFTGPNGDFRISAARKNVGSGTRVRPGVDRGGRRSN